MAKPKNDTKKRIIRNLVWKEVADLKNRNYFYFQYGRKRFRVTRLR